MTCTLSTSSFPTRVVDGAKLYRESFDVNHMLRPANRLYSDAAARAVNVPRFSSILDRIWQDWEGRAPRRIGLAVSGGLDSMALASLCRTVVRQKGDEQRLYAFVVDHQLRQESTREALSVKCHLEKLEIQTHILTLDKASFSHGDRHSHLENSARQLRYRALGEACVQHHIPALFVAHHRDDQAETILIRLLHGYDGAGLAGIRPQAELPTCNGLYGVAESGAPKRLKTIHTSGTAQREKYGMLVESGGVKVFRPLLPFSKAELKATCREADVQWVEDETNKDRGLTLRNTIRYLQNEELLPEALRTSRICGLGASTRQTLIDVEEQVQSMMERLDVRLDLRISRMTCYIPASVIAMFNEASQPARLKASLLRELISLVSPINEIQLSHLGRVANDFLKEDAELRILPSAAGVYIMCDTMGSGDMRYTISRAVPTSFEAKHCMHVPLERTSGEKAHGNWSNWQLWDNRYWIRIGQADGRASFPGEVIVRFSSPHDVAKVKQRYGEECGKRLARRIKLAPGSVRNTLPVVAVRNEVDSEKNEQIVAFPSLNWSVDDWSRLREERKEHPRSQYLYDIRYKKIDDSFTY